MTRHRAAPLAIVAVAAAASAACLRNGFVQDDVVLIVQNSRLHDLGTWWRLFALPFWPPPWSEDLYRPLTSVLLSAQYAAGGGDALPFRLTSILLYAGAALAVLRLAGRLAPWGAALAAAALFAAHPLHVEAVALGVAQNEIVVGCLAALMVTLYLDRRRSGDGALGRADWLALALMFAAAALFKEQGLVLPALLLAAEVTVVPAARPRRGLGRGFLLLGLTGGALLLARARVLGELTGTFAAEALEGLGPGGRALTMLRVVPEWLRLLVWPAHLQADFSPQELVASTSFGLPEARGLAIVIGAAALAWAARRRAPLVTFGVLWTGLGLLPVSNVLVPTGILLAERTLFLPSIGIVLLLGAIVGTAAAAGSGRPRTVALAAAIAVAVILGIGRSATRYRAWRDEAAFTLQGVEDAPASYRMQKAFGQLLFDHGRPGEGHVAYARAIELAPPHVAWRVRDDLARRLWEVGADSLALEQLLASAASAPREFEPRHYLVLGYLALGDYSAAARAADAAMSDGFPTVPFAGLRALADSAARDHAPPGSIRIRVSRPGR